MILVTGGTGFLGSHLLEALVAKGAAVRATKRASSKIPLHLQKNIEWVDADVLDMAALEDAMQGVEKVYHSAAVVSFEAGHHEQMKRVNVRGTENVVNAALYCGVKKLLHVSSVAAIGRAAPPNLPPVGREGALPHEFITERNKWEESKLNSVYALSKYLAEREVWRATQEGLNAVIVNPSMIIGPCDWKQGTGRFFYTASNGMSFYPRGVNGFVYVKDVVNCMVELMESNITGERFIINSENYSYKDFLTAITKYFGVNQPRFEVQSWMTEVVWRGSSLLNMLLGIYPLLTKETARNANHAYYYSNQKIVDAIGYKFMPVEEAVEVTAEAFKNRSA